MKFRDAVEGSIRNFYSGKLPEEAIAASDEEFIYDLSYFEKPDVTEADEDTVKDTEEAPNADANPAA